MMDKLNVRSGSVLIVTEKNCMLNLHPNGILLLPAGIFEVMVICVVSECILLSL